MHGFSVSANTLSMKKIIILMLVLVGMQLCAQNLTPASDVVGHYTYEHSFGYDYEGNHFEVSETGTMDFYPDGTALDSARQVYTVTLKEGKSVMWVYNYISPSRWRVENSDFYFGGIKEQFRMEVIEGNEELELAQKIVGLYESGIDRETKYHLDNLTPTRLQWSLTYRDGHSDTWTFLRN